MPRQLLQYTSITNRRCLLFKRFVYNFESSQYNTSSS